MSGYSFNFILYITVNIESFAQTTAMYQTIFKDVGGERLYVERRPVRSPELRREDLN